MRSLSKQAILLFVLFLTATTLLASGCAKKPVTTATAVPETTVSEDMMQTEGVDEMSLGESAIQDGMAGDYGVATEAVSALQSIQFEFDQYNLSAKAQEVLVGNAAYMQANPDQKVRVEGYCDERGSDEYNLALGQRRALAAKNFMVSLGIDPLRLSVISYGEELPLDPSGTEAAFALNRRVEFKAER
ncbi:MAG: OmpA family protein [Syntrophotaleaceae bacterium]